MMHQQVEVLELTTVLNTILIFNEFRYPISMYRPHFQQKLSF